MANDRRDVEPAGPQTPEAKAAQAKRHEQRQRDFDQANEDEGRED